MIVRCAWCGKHLSGEPAPGDQEQKVSHGICDDCEAKENAKIDTLEADLLPLDQPE